MKVMKDLSVMRKIIKKNIDKADDRTVEIVFKILEEDDDNEDGEDLFENMTPEQEASLLKSIKQADNGEVIPHEEVMKKYKQWFAK
jgi:hypothetical protein